MKWEDKRADEKWDMPEGKSTWSFPKASEMWKACAGLAGILLIAVGGFCFYFYVYQVTPAFSEMTFEYGDQVSRDISDYLLGTEWSVNLGDLDLSRVNEAETGIYTAKVYHGRKEYDYTVTIRDTVPPQILRKEGQVCVALGVTCTVGDIIAGISDVDSRAQAFYFQDGTAYTKFQFNSPGEYEVEVLARDRAGNETREMISVIVDTPPSFKGIHNFYVVPNSEPDYLAAVEAWDDVDGDLTESIRVDDSEVHLDQEGVYPLRYVVEDGYGLETVEKARVLVAAAEDIQELIGSRQIDYRVDTIIGAPNIYDAGVSSHENIRETLEYMRPALVQLYHGTGRGGYSSGSGYIMEVTEDTVFICTNRHVVEKYQTWDIYFFDGTRVMGKTLGVSDVYDVGVASVALADVPEALRRELMTVHIDRSYWESLDQQAIEMALERVDRAGGLIHTATGNLVKVKQEFDWYEKLYHTEVTVELVHGDSGSALMDGYGNLICMAYAYSTDPVRYWCVPLDGILACYEEITGRMPYVY